MPRQADRTREFFAFSEGTPATATTPVVKPHWSCINHSDGGIACDYKIIGAAFKAPLARAHLSGSGKHCGGYVTPQNVCKCGSAESMKFFQRKIEEKAQKVADDLKIAQAAKKEREHAAMARDSDAAALRKRSPGSQTLEKCFSKDKTQKAAADEAIFESSILNSGV